MQFSSYILLPLKGETLQHLLYNIGMLVPSDPAWTAGGERLYYCAWRICEVKCERRKDIHADEVSRGRRVPRICVSCVTTLIE